ncbi:MAG: hypothetical protein D6768_09860, partial [Chloroflexi bacterium]
TDTAPPAPPTPPNPNLAARINGQDFTLAELDREYAFDRAMYRLVNGTSLLQDRGDTLRGLIPTLLVDGLARQAGITVSEAELDANMKRFAAVQQIELADLDAELKKYGYTLTDFRVYVARAVRVERYLAQTFDDPAMDGVNPSDWLAEQRAQADIQIYYQTPAEAALTGSRAPAFELVNLQGQPVSLADYRGRPVILNFWATWCVPCRTEMPLLQAAADQHQAEDLAVVGINFEESPSLVEPYVAELGLTFDILYDEGGEANQTYMVNGLPTTFFIDREGIIRHVQIGQLHPENMEQLLGKIL